MHFRLLEFVKTRPTVLVVVETERFLLRVQTVDAQVCSDLLLPVTGGAEHVQDVSEPLTCVPDDRPGHPFTCPAHQGQRPRPHRRRGAHVHQQPGNAHQIPRVQVRPPALVPIRDAVTVFDSRLQNKYLVSNNKME